MIIKNISVNPTSFPVGETSVEISYNASGSDAIPGGTQTITIEGNENVLFLDESGKAKRTLSAKRDFTTVEKEYTINAKIKVSSSAKKLKTFFIQLEIVGNSKPRTKNSGTLIHS